MRNRTIILVAGFALLAAACGSGGDDLEAIPTETVTVTVTAAPENEPTEDADDVSPSPTSEETPAESPAPPEQTASSTCDDVAAAGGESLAFVFVEEPVPGAEVSPGFEVSGCSNSFEATYEWELLARDGGELASGFGTASCGTGCVGTFSFDVDYTVGEMQVGTLRVFTSSAEDGSVQDLNSIPLRLTP